MALVNAGVFPLRPHKWQAEELLRLGGFLNPYDLTNRTTFDRENPYLLCLAAANSSGKDQFIIALFAVWFAVVGCKNRCIITSSSFEQVKGQTEPHIIDLITAVERLFGKIFRSIEFHHVCALTGSEIKLFATNNAKNAEGYHPWPGGAMAIVINEAKSVSEEIFDALSRCEGYSYWIEISSPGGKSGTFYRHATSGVEYPNLPQHNRYFTRYISAYDCPHISRAHIARFLQEKPQFLIDSSILARFTTVEDDSIIPEHFLQVIEQTPPPLFDTTIGIGLDTAAGVDENSLYVRKGNQVIHKFHFVQKDTALTADLLDVQLAPWKTSNYAFNADDGGVSRGIVDNLVRKGWRITRRLNQSPAYNKREFLNLGIEMWWHLRTLIIRQEIRVPIDPRLRNQLITRFYDGKESVQGKLKIEPKPEHKRRTGESPDRADALVLCFFSYRSKFFTPPATDGSKTRVARASSIEEFKRLYEWDELKPITPKSHGRFTQQVGLI